MLRTAEPTPPIVARHEWVHWISGGRLVVDDVVGLDAPEPLAAGHIIGRFGASCGRSCARVARPKSPRSCQLKGFNPWLPSVWTLAAVVRGPALRPLCCGGLTLEVALLPESVSPAAVTAFPVERDPAGAASGRPLRARSR